MENIAIAVINKLGQGSLIFLIIASGIAYAGYRKYFQDITHEVMPGETLRIIAKRYGIDETLIFEKNKSQFDDEDKNKIQSGRILRIPKNNFFKRD